MKLLIVTQVVDTEDPVLGFFVRWIEEFAKRAEQVTVICLKQGAHTLPENVRVFSLGKERPPRFARRLRYALRFLRLARQERANYDTVFVHMNPEYIALAGWLWHSWGKRVALWYTHKSVTRTLRVAVNNADVVFTASRESFRLPTKKLQIVGHGIDTATFAPQAHKQKGKTIRILTTGRVSATKRISEMLDALDVLAERGVDFTFTIAGAPATDADEVYEEQLRASIRDKSYADYVHFLGPVAHAGIPKLLATHDVFLNLSRTGSMDKAVLEALAAGVPTVTSNEAFQELLKPVPGLFLLTDTPRSIAAAIEKAATADVTLVTNDVRQRFALPETIAKIVSLLADSHR